MPKVEQHPYLSPRAVELRRRDGTRPWQVHPCEVDSVRRGLKPGDPVHREWTAAAELRRAIEAAGH